MDINAGFLVAGEQGEAGGGVEMLKCVLTGHESRRHDWAFTGDGCKIWHRD